MSKSIAELAESACRSVGVQEDHAQLRAREYVRDRMAYIWHGWALRETLILFRITGASAVVESVPAGTVPVGRVYQLPVERVLKVGLEGRTLQPGDLIGAFQRGGLSLEDGQVTFAIEQGRGSAPGTRLVRIVTAPESAPLTLIVLGKKPLPAMADGDLLPIAGIDFALLPFVRGDLWRDRRQMAKAQTEYQEGQHMIEKMLDAEIRQAMGTRKLTPHPMGGVYRSIRAGSGHLSKYAGGGQSSPIWELDGGGNIVPVV